MPVPGPARPLLRLPGARPGRAGPLRREGGLHRRPRPGPGRPAGQAAHPGPGRDRRIRAGQDRRTVPAGQAVPRPVRGGDHLEGPLRLPAHPPRPRRPGAPGDLRARGRGGAADLRRAGRRDHHPPDLPPAQRRRRAHPDRQPRRVGHLHPGPDTAQRGLHRPHLLQPHRDRPGPAARPPLPPGAPPPRRLDRDPLPGHHRRRDVPGRRQSQHRQRQMEPAPRRTRRLAAPRPGQMRALRRRHQLPQDARPQRHLAPLLLLPQPRPAARRRPGPALPRAQHPRRRPR